MKNILVLTDFSENASTATEYAAQMAKETGAALIILHTETAQVAIAESTMVMDTDQATIKNCEQKIQQQAQKLQEQFGFNQPIATLCLTGSLSLVLNQVIKNKQVDLVVMGTKGATNFINKFIAPTRSLLLNLLYVRCWLFRPIHPTPAYKDWLTPQISNWMTDFICTSYLILLNLCRPKFTW